MRYFRFKPSVLYNITPYLISEADFLDTWTISFTTYSGYFVFLYIRDFEQIIGVQLFVFIGSVEIISDIIQLTSH